MAGTNGFDAVPLDWSTISFVEPPTWVGLAPESHLVATIALQGLGGPAPNGGPPPRSNAPPIAIPDWYEEQEEILPPGPDPVEPEPDVTPAA